MMMMMMMTRSMYEGVTTAVKLRNCESQEFDVKVGVHQGSVLSPLLFIIVMQALSNNFKAGLPWELLYADDLILVAESEEKLRERIEIWNEGIEEKGLRVNISKTKVMKCQVVMVQAEDLGKYPWEVSKKGVGRNSIQCTICEKWVHKRCSGVKGNLRNVVDFTCKKCAGPVESVELKLDEKSQFVLNSGEVLECVDKFCYLGDMIGRGGGVEEAVRNRVRCAWCKFRELYPLLAMRDSP